MATSTYIIARVAHTVADFVQYAELSEEAADYLLREMSSALGPLYGHNETIFLREYDIALKGL
jgi:hypothetical protein